MKLAITIWENRISPVFDAAKQLLLVNLEQKQVVEERVVAIKNDPFATVLRLQKEEAITLLLCGALCEWGAERLRGCGLEVVPFLSGDVEVVLQCLVTGADPATLAMPGCQRQCCCRRRQESAWETLGIISTEKKCRGGRYERWQSRK